MQQEVASNEFEICSFHEAWFVLFAGLCWWLQANLYTEDSKNTVEQSQLEAHWACWDDLKNRRLGSHDYEVWYLVRYNTNKSMLQL